MRNKSFGSNTFRKTFLSYTAILLIPIFVFSALNAYRNVIEEKRELYEKHAADAKRIADSMDNKLNELKNLGKVLSDETWVTKMMSNTNVFDQEFDLIKMQEIRKDLHNAVGAMSILSFGAVIFPEKELVLSEWGDSATDVFFSSIASFDDETRMFFDDSIPKYTYFKIMQPVNMKHWGSTQRVIPVLQSLEVVGSPRAVLLLFIDSAYLADYIQRFGGSEYDEIMVSTKDSPVYRQSRTMVGDRQAQGVSYELVVSSQASDWQYKVTYPDSTVIGIRNVFGSLLAILISVLFGTPSAFLLAKVSYRPLAALLHKLSEAVRNDDSGSEYKLIEKSFDRLMLENHTLQRAVEDYESAAKSNLLLRMLKGYFTDDQHMNGLKKFGLGYKEDMYYCTMLISFQTMREISDLEIIRKIEVITIMVVESVMNRHQLDYELFEVTNADKAMIVSSGQRFGEDGHLERIASEIEIEICKMCDIRPDVFHGAIEKGLVGISKSYYAANESLQVALFSRGNARAAQEDAIETNVDYYYPTDWEVQLINNLKIGNLDTLTHILDEISTENRKRQLSDASTIKLVSLLMETMLRVLQELNIDAGIYAKQFESKVKTANGEALWSYVFEVGTLICERMRYSNTTSAMEVGGKMLLYVNENYTSTEVSLKKLADLFQMSVSSVSKMFKEVTGINFYDYLCRLRMESAKELLREKKCGVDDVALRVGYENVYSFKRAFVRYEGIKPDQYAQLAI
ncbi:helix-turn-helix domain-containing protein [Paenibacillus sp. LMG 31460]|uniref:Helix-turn-helix domain-containing protein n=1 Tax=Paenibacillus germinis TaxID=2654979 RepID=A0ABX1Z113_9BACL|nr:AraC family transcriptional regulator [Paenibacillus germinis]NOU85580.1 helix-turn-helix domain-containing protein [Paenibacillus germinis]